MSDDDTNEKADEHEAGTRAETASDAVAKASDEVAKASDEVAKPSVEVAKAPSARLPEPPLPAAGTPEGAALRRALALYELGDYAGMRALLAPLANAKDPAVADAAAGLLRRIAVDPVQIGFLVGCLAAILAIAFHYLGQ